jgi:hypothetical protein
VGFAPSDLWLKKVVSMKLHGISLEQLLAQGRPPSEVARRMNAV